MVENYVKLLKLAPKIKSLSLLDTRIDKNVMQFVAKSLDDKARKAIYGLCFRYCYLDLKSIMVLSLGLKVNRSLIKLDLSNNALSSVRGL